MEVHGTDIGDMNRSGIDIGGVKEIGIIQDYMEDVVTTGKEKRFNGTFDDAYSDNGTVSIEDYRFETIAGNKNIDYVGNGAKSRVGTISGAANDNRDECDENDDEDRLRIVEGDKNDNRDIDRDEVGLGTVEGNNDDRDIGREKSKARNGYLTRMMKSYRILREMLENSLS